MTTDEQEALSRVHSIRTVRILKLASGNYAIYEYSGKLFCVCPESDVFENIEICSETTEDPDENRRRR